MSRRRTRPKKPGRENLTAFPDSKRILHFANAKSPLDLLDALEETELSDSQSAYTTPAEFENNLRSELSKLETIQTFLSSDRISNPLVDSAVFSVLLPVSANHKTSDFFQNKILEKGNQLLADPKIVADAQKRIFQLSLGENFHKIISKPQPQPKPILVARTEPSKEKHVHFLPANSDIIPPGAVTINPKQCEETRKARKARKKAKERNEVIDFEAAIIEEVRTQYRTRGRKKKS